MSRGGCYEHNGHKLYGDGREVNEFRSLEPRYTEAERTLLEFLRELEASGKEGFLVEDIEDARNRRKGSL